MDILDVPPIPSKVGTANQQVLDYIETTFNAILHEIQQPSGEGRPVITLSRITAARPYFDDEDHMRPKWHIDSRVVNYHLPGKTKDEAWRFGK